MHQKRLLQSRFGFKLRKKSVHIVNVLRALHLGDHDHIELVADFANKRRQIIERPWRVKTVHPGPQLGVSHRNGLAHMHQPGACRLFVGGRNSVFEIAEEDIHGGGDLAHLGHHFGV